MNRRHCMYVTVFFAALVLALGCMGGGGGGGNGLNPLGTGSFSGETADLSGRVTLDGVPLANVNVYLYDSESALSAGMTGLASTFASLRMSLLAAQQSGVYTTTTDDAGYYHFQGVPAGEYSLIAVQDATHQYARTGMVLRGAVTNVDAQITPTGSIQGTISAPGRADAGGAMVYLEGTSYVALTNQAGRFTIANVPTGATFQLRVTLGTYALTTPVAVMAPPGSAFNTGTLTLVEQQLPPSYGSVVGSATRAAFAPGDLDHSGTLVFLKDSGGFPAGITISAAEGGYQMSAIKPGKYQLQFAADNYTISPESVAVVVAANETTVASAVSLMPKTTAATQMLYTGQVTKTEFPAGHSDHAGITLLMVNDYGSFLAVTDSNGEFRFSLPAGTYRFQALETFRLTSSESGATVLNGSASITLPATRGLFRVQPSVSNVPLVTADFRGTVTKSTFRPGEVTHAGINVTLSGHTGCFVATTNADGEFSFSHIPEGTYHFTALSPFTLLDDSDKVIAGSATVVLPGGAQPDYHAQILALVRDSISGNVTKQSLALGQTDHSGIGLYLESGNGGFQTETDSTGAFAFSDVPRGTYRLRAMTPFRLVSGGDSQVVDGSMQIILPLQDELKLEVEFLAGTAVRYSGKVLKSSMLSGETNHSGVELVLTNSASSFLEETDADGNFSFTAVPVGVYRLRVLAPYRLIDGEGVIDASYTLSLLENKANSFTFSVEPLSPGLILGGFKGTIIKRATRRPGENNGGVPILVASSTIDYQRSFVSDADGYFVVTGLPVGEYDLTIGNDDYIQATPAIASAEATVGLNDLGKISVLPVTSEPGLVSGRVSPPTAKLPMELVSTNDAVQITVTTDSDGDFVFNFVPPGSYIIRSKAGSGWQGETSRFTVVSGGTHAAETIALTDVTPVIGSFAWQGNTAIIVINGSNFDPDTARFFAGATLLERYTDGNDWTDTQAEVMVGTLPPGSYDLRLKNGDGLTAKAEDKLIIAPCTLTGTVVKTGSLPGQHGDAGVVLYLAGEAGGFRAESDSDGKFEFSRIPRGSYQLQALLPYRLSDGGTVVNASMTITLPHTDTLSLSVELIEDGLVEKGDISVVSLPNFTPAAGVNLTLTNSAGSYLFTTDADGVCSYTRIPVGTYTIHALAPYKLVDEGGLVINGSATTFLPYTGWLSLQVNDISTTVPAAPEIDSFDLDITNHTISINGSNFGVDTESTEVFAGEVLLTRAESAWSDTYLEVDISTLSPGIYRLRVKNGDGTTGVASTPFAILSGPKAKVTSVTNSSINIAWKTVLYATHYSLLLTDQSGQIVDGPHETSNKEFSFEAVASNTDYTVQLQPCFNDFVGPAVHLEVKTRSMASNEVEHAALADDYLTASLEAYNGRVIIKAFHGQSSVEYMLYNVPGGNKVGESLSLNSNDFEDLAVTLGRDYVYFADQETVYKRAVNDLQYDIASLTLIDDEEQSSGRILALQYLPAEDPAKDEVVVFLAEPQTMPMLKRYKPNLEPISTIEIDDASLPYYISQTDNAKIVFARNRSCVLITYRSSESGTYALIKWPDGTEIWRKEGISADPTVIAPYNENDFCAAGDNNNPELLIFRKISNGTPDTISTGLLFAMTANQDAKNRLWAVTLYDEASFRLSIMDTNFTEKKQISLGSAVPSVYKLHSSMIDPVTRLMVFLAHTGDETPKTALYWVDTEY